MEGKIYDQFHSTIQNTSQRVKEKPVSKKYPGKKQKQAI